MDCEENDQKGVHRNNKPHIVNISSFLQSIHADKYNGEQVEHDAMVDRANTTPERAEGEELFSGPDLVYSIRVLNFLFLDGLLVELSRDLIPVNVTEELEVVQNGHEVRPAHDSLYGPVVDGAILLAVHEFHCVTFRPEFARSRP